ncbi:hypothetical protein SDC9_127255 [bioreactor metagenome]|uniref:Uncharacterized protein n=1 Tax=bioreactor metagenome TaxID=1076179 RepID=A0A645CTL8_9ZZZZ
MCIGYGSCWLCNFLGQFQTISVVTKNAVCFYGLKFFSAARAGFGYLLIRIGNWASIARLIASAFIAFRLTAAMWCKCFSALNTYFLNECSAFWFRIVFDQFQYSLFALARFNCNRFFYDDARSCFNNRRLTGITCRNNLLNYFRQVVNGDMNMQINGIHNRSFSK